MGVTRRGGRSPPTRHIARGRPGDRAALIHPRPAIAARERASWAPPMRRPLSAAATCAESFTRESPSAAPGLTAHHAVAETLHLELAHVASPAFAFAFLAADQFLTLLLQPRLLRGVRRTRQHHERKHQRDHPHFGLHTLLRSVERDCGAFIASATAPRM